jgi:beta-xylosidase
MGWKRNVRRLLVAGIVLFVLIYQVAAGGGVRLFRYTNPIRSEVIGPIRDPQIINVGDMYYLTGTTSPFWPGTVCPGIKLWSSKDLLNWKFEGFLIERSKLAEDVWYRDRFWASEIHQKGGKFWLTFNCRNESEKYPHVHSCGLAVAEKITGPYKVLTHEKPLLEGWGNDMTLFTDDDGKTYAYWKRHFVQEIDLENARLVGERRRTIKCYDQGWEKSHLEGMFIIKRGGVYYMFYSAWTRGYEVGYATAKHPMGPWTKYEGNPIYGGQDEQRCKEMGVEFTGDPNSPYYGVGHCTIFTGPDGRDWICAHHHMKGCGPRGSDIHLGFDPIWIEDGVVKTNGSTYTEQVIRIPSVRR